ncbi:MAG TPA: antibiotic biosynthesis monooxygenase family protein [Alphaproteobacteria bacterium]|jgi:heme-degrading monooxygenase HmoA
MSDTTVIRSGSSLVTGINVFNLPRDRHEALIETLDGIDEEILKIKFPMNVSATFHRAVEAPVVINYNQYTDRKAGRHLRTCESILPLMERTHELSESSEIRWYSVADVVAVDGGDQIEVVDDRGRIGVIGIFTVAPEKQADLLAAFKRYGETVKAAPGFGGLATHRGLEAEHVSTYEVWDSAAAYRSAISQGPAAETLAAARATATAAELHPYDVVRVCRFNPGT